MKAMSDFGAHIRKQNTHWLYLSTPGSLIIEGIKEIATQNKFAVEIP